MRLLPVRAAAFGSAQLVTLLWRQVDNIVHAGDTIPATAPAAAM